MRKLKIELADEKTYTFSTLTIKEQTIARKFEKLTPEEQKQMDEIVAKSAANTELTDEEEAKLDAFQEKQIRGMLKILLMSIAKHHEEYRSKEDIDKLYDKLENLIDLRDMKRLTSFALMGTLPRDEEVETFEFMETIDLTDKK